MSPPDIDATAAQHFGFVLWSLRNAAGLSRAKLSKLCRISEATIKLLEAGNHFPSANTLYRLMSVPLLRLTPALVRDLFGVSALVHVEYETEPPKRITPDTQQIVIRLILTLKDKQ